MKKRIIPKKASSYQQWLTTFSSDEDILNYFIEHEYTAKELSNFYALPSLIKPLLEFAKKGNGTVPYNYVSGIKSFYIAFNNIKDTQDCQKCFDMVQHFRFSSEQGALLSQVIATNHSTKGRQHLPPPVDSILSQIHYGEALYDIKKGCFHEDAGRHSVYWWYDHDKKAERMAQLDTPLCNTHHIFALTSFYLYLSDFLLKEDYQFMIDLIKDWCERPYFFTEVGHQWSIMKDTLPWFNKVLPSDVKELFFQYVPLTILKEKEISPWAIDNQIEAIMELDSSISWSKLTGVSHQSEIEVHW